jgi:hypothetical protein
MKLLVFVATVTLVTCASPVDGDILLEINAKFQRLAAENTEMKTEMKAEISELKAEITELKAQRNATIAGELKFFVDGRTVCPDGTVEVNATKGRILLGRPEGGKTGEVFNRPLEAGEVGRSPPHSHAVTVNDPGHTHVGIVNDPGHKHILDVTDQGGASSKGSYHATIAGAKGKIPTENATTGISVENLPAKSAVSVSVDANDAGEHLPLVYVLICQKVA